MPSRVWSLLARRGATAAEVTQLHQVLLDRPANAREVAAHAGRDIVELVSALAASEAHRAIQCSATHQDVERLYHDLLRRPPEGPAAFGQRLGKPLLDVAIGVARSDEFRLQSRGATAADIEVLYRLVLGRPPESEAAVAARIGLPLVDLAADLLGSAEGHQHWHVDVNELQRLCVSCLGAPVEEAWADTLIDVIRSFGIGPAALVEHLLRMRARQTERHAPDGANGTFAGLPRRAPARSVEPRHVGSAVSLVVPTMNSARWIGAVAAFYDAIGVRPIYAVDRRTDDETREVLTAAGCRWIEVTSEAPRVEALLPDILRQVDSLWVLRLDDDELPAPELLQFCDDIVERDESPVWGFPRLCLRWAPGDPALRYSQFLSLGPPADMDRQWRLFRPRDVRLRDTLHSPGFDCEQRAPAGESALILHFDWVLRSADQRRSKLESYQAQTGDAHDPRRLLYEDVPDDWHLFEVYDDPRMLAMARALYHAGHRPT